MLQGGRLEHDGWYRLLNLGYTDQARRGHRLAVQRFPGRRAQLRERSTGRSISTPGSNRSDKGHTYVTNGPLLEFTVNGSGMGEELRVKRGTKLRLVAEREAQSRRRHARSARARGARRRRRHAVGAGQGQRDAAQADHRGAQHVGRGARLRQRGRIRRNMTIAHSAPIYVVVDDEPTWKRDAVPTIVAEIRGRLQRILTDPLDSSAGIGEASPTDTDDRFETRLMLDTQWLLQRPLLKPQVDMADAAYQKLLDTWAKYSGVGRRLSSAAATPGGSLDGMEWAPGSSSPTTAEVADAHGARCFGSSS